MRKFEALANLVLKASVIGFLSLTFAVSSYAQDSDRIKQLEKEIQEIKLRLSNLEAPQGNSNSRQRPVVSSEGWKVLANWRALEKGMTPNDVRATLGEPERIRAAAFTNWLYPNSGNVTFYEGKVDGWTEPR